MVEEAPMNILILEDSEADAELVQRELRRAGFHFRACWAPDMASFAVALERSAPDVVLADYALPGFDGLAALTLARQRWGDVPFIIVSGAIGEELAIDTLKAGSTDYVLKQRLSRLGPVVQRALVEARAWAEKRQAEEALREANATLESKVAQRTTELQRRTQQLQRLTLELLQTEERERRRIAVLLHEGLQQQIAGARFHLSTVRGRVKDARMRADIEEVEAVLKDTIEQSRSLSRDLNPAMVHMNDLAEVLHWLAGRVRAQQGLNIRLEVRGDMMLRSEGLALFLFLAVEEMLFNVARHAQVREAAVHVRRIGSCVCLSVSDRGRGFDSRVLKETSGVGLFSIRERTELLGGRLKVRSAKGKGSRISIMVPDDPALQIGM